MRYAKNLEKTLAFDSKHKSFSEDTRLSLAGWYGVARFRDSKPIETALAGTAALPQTKPIDVEAA